LVATSDAHDRSQLLEMLGSWGLKPAFVSDTAKAAKLLHKRYQEGKPCHLVLAAVDLPRANGLSLAQYLQQSPQWDCRVIHLLPQEYDDREADRIAQDSGAPVLRKPVSQPALLDAMMALLGIESTEDEDSSDKSSISCSQRGPYSILLVEDSAINQKLAVALLQKVGHKVSVAGNGVEALDALASQYFDLVLMDVQMPEMDGLEATRIIRQRERETGAHIPIVALTAHALQGDRERCLAAGMDAHVPKPIRAQQLLEAIESLVRR